MEYISNSAEDTFNWARSLASGAKPGDIYCLTGDLGSGKTVFAKGFGLGLGVSEVIVSPTFTLINIYDSPGQRLPLYHFDVYRISGPHEMDDTGYEEFFYGQGVCLIEKRLMDVVTRHGFNDFTLRKWAATFALKDYFDKLAAGNVYVFPLDK